MPGSPATWDDASREWRDPRLSTTRFGPVRWFELIDSTNRCAVDEAARGAHEGLVVVADEQTAGRGRLGRGWIAPPRSSLLVSVLLRPQLPTDRMHLVTLAAALSAVDAVAQVADVTARLKWPNDVVVGDRKLAGILAETAGPAVVVGMGLNVRWHDFPAEIAATATALNLCGARDDALDIPTLLVAWLVSLDARLDALDHAVADAIACSATLGRAVRVDLADESFTGIAHALTAEGYLRVLQDDGRERVVTSGDVVHLRLTD
jgi:BirA family biotin operon repressor/biotin-[acetyl-CoA-carboxylase] ligase